MVEIAEKGVQEEKLVITLTHKLTFLFLASLTTVSYLDFWFNGHKEIVTALVCIISLCTLDLLWDTKDRIKVLIGAGVLNTGVLIALFVSFYK